MRFIFYQLLRPFSYLRIKHEDKWIYDWLIPALTTALTMLWLYYFVPLENLGGENGLVNGIVGFVSNLPGFFIAALAAVATFNKNDIDQLMANPPKIEIIHHGHPLMIEMTRRRFLCVLFSYLTAVSIFLTVGGKIGLACEVTSDFVEIASWSGVVLFMFVFWQMLIATVLGLYYLGERLHTPQ